MRCTRLFSSTRTRLLSLVMLLPAGLLAAQKPSAITLNLAPFAPTTVQHVSVTATLTPARPSTSSVRLTVSQPGQPSLSVLLSPSAQGSSAYTGYLDPLAAGKYTLQAAYSGQPGYLPATSPVLPMTVTEDNASALQGQYAFLYQGYTSALYAGGAGLPAAGIGTFTADGQGNITAGLASFVLSPSEVHDQASLTGSYTVNAYGNGTLILDIAGLGRQTMQLAAPNVLGGRGVANGTATPSDGLFRGAIQVARQTPSDFSLSALNGAFTFNLAGAVTGSAPAPVYAAGAVQIFGAGPGGAYGGLEYSVGSNVQSVAYAAIKPSAPDPASGFFSLSFAVFQILPYGVLTQPTLEFVTVDATHLFLLNMTPSLPPISGVPTSEILSGTANQ